MNNQIGINTDNPVSWASYTSKWLVLLERKSPRGLLGQSLCPSTKPFCCLGSVRNQTSPVAWAAVWQETYTHQPQILARCTLHYWLSSPTEPLSAYRSLLDPMCVGSLRVWQVSIGSHSAARPGMDQWVQGAVLQGMARFWCGLAWDWWQAQHGPMSSRRAVLQGVIRFWCGLAWGWWQAKLGPMSGRMCSGFGGSINLQQTCALAASWIARFWCQTCNPTIVCLKKTNTQRAFINIWHSVLFSLSISSEDPSKEHPWSLLFLPSFDPKPLSIHHALKSSQGYPWAWVEPTQRRNNSTLFDWNNGDASAEDGRAWIFSNVGAYMPIGRRLTDLFQGITIRSTAKEMGGSQEWNARWLEKHWQVRQNERARRETHSCLHVRQTYFNRQGEEADFTISFCFGDGWRRSR